MAKWEAASDFPGVAITFVYEIARVGLSVGLREKRHAVPDVGTATLSVQGYGADDPFGDNADVRILLACP